MLNTISNEEAWSLFFLSKKGMEFVVGYTNVFVVYSSNQCDKYSLM